jgi:hypothetical protein
MLPNRARLAGSGTASVAAICATGVIGTLNARGHLEDVELALIRDQANRIEAVANRPIGIIDSEAEQRQLLARKSSEMNACEFPPV